MLDDPLSNSYDRRRAGDNLVDLGLMAFAPSGLRRRSQ